ncbi:hypothetical protein [Geothrix fuzhouensis]|uniref:hypothetical protein n=1 Tax=Geothrix fuzhouensis TaxID=2966451 RepID=UPI0021485E0D|nr:hypothetical protein [Geothrix fuzhouensis]
MTELMTAPQAQPKACPETPLLSYEEAPPETQALVDYSAMERAAFCWKEAEATLIAEARMTEAESLELQAIMCGHFKAVAVRIFDTRAENPGEWSTWLRILREVMTEAEVRFEQVPA